MNRRRSDSTRSLFSVAFIGLLIAILLPHVPPARATPSLPPPRTVSVMANTNGVVQVPTNFVSANNLATNGSFAPASGSTNYAPATGSTNYAPATGSTNYDAVGAAAAAQANAIASAMTNAAQVANNGSDFASKPATLQNLGATFSQTIAESANFTASVRGALYNVTTGTNAIVVTLPAPVNGGFFAVRKADSGSGTVTVNGSLIGTQGHMEDVVCDGTNFYNKLLAGAADSSGNVTVTLPANANYNVRTSGSGQFEINGTNPASAYDPINSGTNAYTASTNALLPAYQFQTQSASATITNACVAPVTILNLTVSGSTSTVNDYIPHTNAMKGYLYYLHVQNTGPLNTVNFMDTGGSSIGTAAFSTTAASQLIPAYYNGSNWTLLPSMQPAVTQAAINAGLDAAGGLATHNNVTATYQPLSPWNHGSNLTPTIFDSLTRSWANLFDVEYGTYNFTDTGSTYTGWGAYSAKVNAQAYSDSANNPSFVIATIPFAYENNSRYHIFAINDSAGVNDNAVNSNGVAQVTSPGSNYCPSLWSCVGLGAQYNWGIIVTSAITCSAGDTITFSQTSSGTDGSQFTIVADAAVTSSTTIPVRSVSSGWTAIPTVANSAFLKINGGTPSSNAYVKNTATNSASFPASVIFPSYGSSGPTASTFTLNLIFFNHRTNVFTFNIF